MNILKYSLIVLLLASIGGLDAQTSDRQYKQIQSVDSLVAGGEYDLALQKLDAFVAATKASNGDYLANRSLGRARQAMQSLLENFQTIKTNSGEENTKFAIQYRNLRHFYLDGQKGEKSEKYFKRFLALSDSGSHSRALQQYHLASFARKLYLELQLLKKLTVYRAAEKLAAEEKYAQALTTLQSLDFPIRPNQHLAELQESVNTLRIRTEKQYQSHKKAVDQWRRDIKTDKRLSLIAGINLFHQNAVHDRPIDFGMGFSEVIRKTSGKERIGTSLGIEYQIASKFLVGALFANTNYNYTSELESRLIIFDFDVRLSSYQLYLKYLIRPQIGLQPFAEIGVGGLQYIRQKSILSIARMIPGESEAVIFDYIIPDKSAFHFQMAYNLGIQYVPNAEGRFSLGFKGALLNTTDNFGFVDRANFYLSTYLRFSL